MSSISSLSISPPMSTKPFLFLPSSKKVKDRQLKQVSRVWGWGGVCDGLLRYFCDDIGVFLVFIEASSFTSIFPQIKSNFSLVLLLFHPSHLLLSPAHFPRPAPPRPRLRIGSSFSTSAARSPIAPLLPANHAGPLAPRPEPTPCLSEALPACRGALAAEG